MKWLGSLLGGMGPRVGLPLARYALQPDASLTTDIAPAPEKMRMLKLRLAQGETRLRIFNAAGACDIDMHDQEERTLLPRAAGDPGAKPHPVLCRHARWRPADHPMHCRALRA
jgi:hypothetical protein